MISTIETIPIRVPLEHVYEGSYYRMRNRCTIITRIHTEDGLVGECYNADADEDQAEIIRIIREEIAPRLRGRDSQRIEDNWQAMLPITFDQLRDRRLAMQAIACVDSALWDAFGKRCGQPLWRLWGGAQDRLPMIGIGGYYGSSEADLERDVNFFRLEHGMVGMKFKIGGKPPSEDADRLRAVREIAGEEFVLVVDANQGYTVAEALEFLRLVEDIPLRWFEEPTRWHGDIRSLRDVRLRGNVDVAAGQSEISRVGMREMIGSGSIDVCNFDASWGGGPTEWRRVAALALSYDVELGHHEEAQVSSHLLASMPNGTFAEAFSPRRDPIFWQMWANRPDLVDGCLVMPEAPGFGWTLDDDFIERYRADR